MKPRWLKILLIALIIFFVFSMGVYIFMAISGKSFIIKRLEALTQRKVTIGYFDLTPPLNLEIRNLNIEGLAKVDSISFSPSVPSLLTGKIALNRIKIVRPEITLERKLPPEPAASVVPSKDQIITAVKSADIRRRQNRMHLRILKQFTVKDGKIIFTDHTVGPGGITITVKDINFNLVNNRVFPFSTITVFDLKGKIPWREGNEEGKIEAGGWLNFSKKDMKASLKISDIDGIYLYPYYSNWVDLEKARIEKANLAFSSEINGLDNNVAAACHLELTDIVRKPRPPEVAEEKAERIANAVLDVFKTMDKGKIVLDFTIRTKMDRPQFGFGNIKMAFEDKLAMARGGGFRPQDILMIPQKLLQGTIKGAADLTKAVISGTSAVGSELKKAVEVVVQK